MNLKKKMCFSFFVLCFFITLNTYYYNYNNTILVIYYVIDYIMNFEFWHKNTRLFDYYRYIIEDVSIKKSWLGDVAPYISLPVYATGFTICLIMSKAKIWFLHYTPKWLRIIYTFSYRLCSYKIVEIMVI